MTFRTKTTIKNIISAIIVMLIMIVGLFSITGVIFYYIYTPAHVSSFSMYPTINENAPDFTTKNAFFHKSGARRNGGRRCLYQISKSIYTGAWSEMGR